jgi:hypothetical protein
MALIAPTSSNRRAQIFICGQRWSVLYRLTFRIGCSCVPARFGTSAHSGDEPRATISFSSSQRWDGFFGPGNGDLERDKVRLC